MERGLIIKKEWLDRIFDGGKVWEMRSTRTSVRGRVGLIESGTGLIVGEAFIFNVLGPIPNSHLMANKGKHQVNIEDIGKWRYAWEIKDAIRYKKPIKYQHPKGAVIWVKVNI